MIFERSIVVGHNQDVARQHEYPNSSKRLVRAKEHQFESDLRSPQQ
jgi:hypothetical protein